MTPKNQRLMFVFISVLLCIAAVQLILYALRDNIIYFYTPRELAAHTAAHGKPVRVGGLVLPGSVMRQDGVIAFSISEGQAVLKVTYSGELPALFREGQGVVAEGVLGSDGLFVASQLLAKHDENYMPKEVADRLKASGYWRQGTPTAQ